jgi:hypothetical protein
MSATVTERPAPRPASTPAADDDGQISFPADGLSASRSQRTAWLLTRLNRRQVCREILGRVSRPAHRHAAVEPPQERRVAAGRHNRSNLSRSSLD